MPTKIDPLFRLLDAMGFVDIFLPFVIVVTVLYAFLEKTKVLGVEKGHARHQLNAASAVVIGLLVVGSSKVLGITTVIVQYVGLLAVVVLAVALLLGLFGVQHLPENKWWDAVFFVVFMVVAVGVFYAMGWFGRGSDVFVAVFVIFFLILFIIKMWLKKVPPGSNQLPAHPATHGHPPSPRGGAAQSPRAHAARAAAPQAPQRRPTVPTRRSEFEEIPFGEEELPSFGDEEGG